MLFQSKVPYAHFPEAVDLAVIGCGLGALQNKLSFVKQTSRFWDTTYWGMYPRPFLDTPTLAYANAISAWFRGDQNPEWASVLTSDVARPMKKSLKYLFKTEDSFFHKSTIESSIADRQQQEWLDLANNKSISKQILAIRHLSAEAAEADPNLRSKQEAVVLDKLRSPDRPVLLHTISAAERLKLNTDPIAEELRLLLENRDDEIRAKALVSLTSLGLLDDETISQATKMLDDNVKYVVFSGAFALSTLESVSDDILPPANRAFIRALQSCDYEFIGLFAAAFNRWLDDPQAHIEQLLQEDSPELLEVGLDALKNVQESLVGLK